MHGSLVAAAWGLVAGSALVLGAAIGWFVSVPQRVVAGIMAFGGGVLISALSFDLMDEAYHTGGWWPTACGFLAGAGVYSLANAGLSHSGGRHRKRSQNQQAKAGSGGLAIALGALLDGIPESIVIGLSLLSGGEVSTVAVAAVFLSNVPEGLSSASGMRRAGRTGAYVFGVWAAIAVASGIAAWLGFVAFGSASQMTVAATMAIAAGAILAMLSDTMIPEAVEHAHDWTGLLTVFGFLLAFGLSRHLGG
jgi:ZIP family zinc transporter